MAESVKDKEEVVIVDEGSTKVDEDIVTDVGEDVKDGTNEGVDGKVEDNGDDEKGIMIPKERFDQINNKYKEVTKQLEGFAELKEKFESEMDALKQSEEGSQTVIEETTEKLEKQAKQYETLLTSVYEDKLKVVPEELQELIPSGLSTEDRISWINKAEEKGLFKVKKKEDIVVGQPLNHSAEQTKEERLKKMNPLQLLTSYYGIGK